MRWRLSKLNWSYGLGELIIVIAGVLTALSVDQWNSDRLDRLEERRIVERLIFDLNTDLDEVAIMLRSLDNKEASLLRVIAVLAAADAPPQDPAEFLSEPGITMQRNELVRCVKQPAPAARRKIESQVALNVN